MALEQYKSKRRFDSTPEPAGGKHAGSKHAGSGPLRFVVQKHQASRLHYDFRLELDGVLKSWAVPKGPSLDPADKRLAMMVEDHPFDYRTFEGIIPKGNYGAGTVMVWDEGTYAPWAEVKGEWQEVTQRAAAAKVLRAGLHKGHLTFILHGKKLHGEFALIKIKDSDDANAWLLLKKGDQRARPGYDVTTDDHSAATGRDLDQIAGSADRQWSSTTAELDLTEAPKAAPPGTVRPMLATLTDQPFDRPDWLFEVKWDGYRAIADTTGKQPQLYSRNAQDFRQKFAPVGAALAALGHQAVLDGEVVAVDEQGRSRFQLLQNYQTTGQGNLLYYVFDLLYLDGHDLTGWPLRRRKQALAQILPPGGLIRYSDHVEEQGTAFFAAARQNALEGMVAKAADSTYLPGKRSHTWLKVKTSGRQEVVIGGYTEPRGSRQGVGSLILGVYEGQDLVFVGHSGGSFGPFSPEDMLAKLKPLKRKTCPFKIRPKSTTAQHWITPKLVAEVEFTEWTGDGSMRHPKLVGLRQDKPADQVKREIPKPAAASPTAARPAAAPPKRASSKEQLVEIGGHKLKLTNLGKVYWPDDGYTKGDLIEYYRRISPTILPYLKDRPESLNRHPGGITGPSFYQKDMRGEAPAWAKTVKIYSESNSADIEFLLCQDETALVYMANLGCIEINPWNSTYKKPDQPDYLVIDLDPEDIGFEAVIEAAQATKQVLDQAGAACYPKTSGATGMHIYVPLGAKYDYDQCRQFAQIVSTLINQRLPATTSITRSPAKRQQRIYLDYLQNRRGQTLASAYSVRPKPGATVSTPLDWSEVTTGLKPTDFTITNIFDRLDQVGDLWRPVLGPGIDLAACLGRLAG